MEREGEEGTMGGAGAREEVEPAERDKAPVDASVVDPPSMESSDGEVRGRHTYHEGGREGGLHFALIDMVWIQVPRIPNAREPRMSTDLILFSYSLNPKKGLPFGGRVLLRRREPRHVRIHALAA